MRKIFLVLIFSFSAKLYAQDNYLGAGMNYSFGVPSSFSRTEGNINRYGIETPGTSADHQYGFGINYLGRKFFSEYFGISSSLSFTLSSGSFHSEPFDYTEFDPFLGSSITHQITYDVVSSLGLLSLEILPQYYFTENFSFGAGVWSSYRLNSAIFQQENILSTNTIRAVSAGEDIASSSFRYGPELSLSYSMKINDGMILVPSLRSALDMQSLLTDNIGARSIRGGAAISLLFDISPRKNFPEGNIIAGNTAPQVIFTLELKSRDPQGATIARNDRLHKQFFFLPGKFSSDELKSQILLNKDEVNRFSVEKLINHPVKEIFANTINIFADRLRKNQQTSVSLSGNAEALKQYLTEIWQIAPERISVVPASDTLGDGVALISTSEIFSPLELEWIEQSFHISPLTLHHNIRNVQLVKLWHLTITDGERTFLSQDGADIADLENFSPQLRFAGNAAPEKLMAVLEVTDTLERKYSATDVLLLGRRKFDEEVKEIFFGYGDLLDRKDAIVKIFSEISPSAEIELNFYSADREKITSIMSLLPQNYAAVKIVSNPQQISDFALIVRSKK